MSEEFPPVEGGCLCGRVRYEARPMHREGFYCHCRMCQLAFGNVRVPFLNAPKATFRWTAQAPNYFASSTFATRGFCGHCGSPLSFEYHDSDKMDLSVGSLDDPSAFKPTSHFAIETRVANWHTPDGLREMRMDEHARLMQRWRDAYGSDVVPGVRR